MTACNDPYQGDTFKDGGGGAPDDPPADDCIQLGPFADVAAPDTSDPNCRALATEFPELGDVAIDDYKTKSVDGTGSVVPGTNSVRTFRTSGPNPGSTNRRTPTGSDGSWYATEGDGSPTFYCDPTDYVPTNCTGTYGADILLDYSTEYTCPAYDSVEICLETHSVASHRRVDEDDECAAGSGRFQLIPRRVKDKDHDGLTSTLYTPIQLTGTGRMTNAAWVTRIVKVSDGGNTMYALKPDVNFVINSSDQGVNLSTNAVAITGTHNFSTGAISGNPPFFVGEKDPDVGFNMRVDMTWSCDDDDESWTAVDRPTGYQFTLQQLGCSTIKQAFTLRPRTSPSRIEWAVYGNPNDYQVTPLTSGDFVWDYGRLEIDGTLNSYNSTSASVDFDVIKVDGVSVCTPGTYTLYAE